MTSLSTLRSFFFDSFRILSPASKAKYLALVVFQSFAVILDLIAITLLTSLTLSLIKPTSLQDQNNFLALNRLLFHSTDFGKQIQGDIGALALMVLTAFCVRTLFALFFSHITLIFLANESIRILRIQDPYQNESLTSSTSELQRSIYFNTYGLRMGIIVVLWSASILISEAIALVVMALLMLVTSSTNALLLVVYLSFSTYLLQKFMQKRGSKIAIRLQKSLLDASTQIQVNDRLSKEFALQGTLEEHFESMKRSLKDYFYSSSHENWLHSLPKYFFELALVAAITITIFFNSFGSNTENEMSSIAILLAISFRVLPSVLRLQSGIAGIRSGGEQAKGFVDSRFSHGNIEDTRQKHSRQLDKFFRNDFPHVFTLSMKNIEFTHRKSSSKFSIPANYEFTAGQSLAIVGPSGSGKTTLMNLMLGFLEPNSGSITINNINPRNYVLLNPGKVSYVPQRPFILDGNYEMNVTLNSRCETAESMIISLRTNFENMLKNSTSAPYLDFFEGGKLGNQLSGGQQQVIGIARALNTSPKALFLDESLSAMDQNLTSDVFKFLQKYKEENLLVMITHSEELARRFDRRLRIIEGQIFED